MSPELTDALLGRKTRRGNWLLSPANMARSREAWTMTGTRELISVISKIHADRSPTDVTRPASPCPVIAA